MADTTINAIRSLQTPGAGLEPYDQVSEDAVNPENSDVDGDLQRIRIRIKPQGVVGEMIANSTIATSKLSASLQQELGKLSNVSFQKDSENDPGTTTVDEVLAVNGTSTFAGGATFGGNIVAGADKDKSIFADVTTSTKKITLGGGGTVKTAGDLEIEGGDIVATTITYPANVFATTTGKVSVGGGAVDIGATGAATTVIGSMTVTQAATLSSTLAVSSTSTLTAT